MEIHQYKINIIHKPETELYFPHWLSRQNHKGNNDKEIASLQVNINTIHIATYHYCMMIQEIWEVTINDTQLQNLKAYIIDRWLMSGVDIKQDIQSFWIFKVELVLIDEVTMKGK